MSIGEVLAAARRQAGLTNTQVSQRTRIRETIVRGIERDDFSACGADIYARGHIRSIAHTVGVDPEPLVRGSTTRATARRRPAALGTGQVGDGGLAACGGRRYTVEWVLGAGLPCRRVIVLGEPLRYSHHPELAGNDV